MEGDSPEYDCSTISIARAPSPDLFSSDDENCTSAKFEEHCPELAAPSSPPKAEKASGQNLVLELEAARLQRLMTLLQGVPPPPSVTIPQISLNEVILKLKENADIFVIPEKVGSEPVESLWKPTASLDEVLKTDWPQIKNIVYHDVHYNNCTASEDVEHVSMKLHERFIGAETSSWCNPVTLPTVSKRQRRSLGNASPGCRLSHLARRRQTFSSANLAQLSSVAGSGTAGGAPVPGGSLTGTRRRLMNGSSTGQRCIMVEIKKTDKNKRIKTNSKEALMKLPQNAAGAPKVVAPIQVPVQTTKRALFQSPEEHKQSAPSSQPAVSDPSMAQRSKRVLWPSDNEAINDNGKRALEKSDSSSSQTSKKHCADDRVPYNRTTRSLPFPVGQNPSTSCSSSSTQPNLASAGHSTNKSARRASDQGPSSQAYNLNVELSELHKRKLFWAIMSALRTHNINKSHPDFTRLTSILAFHYIEVRSNLTGPPPSSTSEHMLQVVSVKASEILQAERTGQEENLGAGKLLKKEGSGKELFRDATASLNVRRSLCVSLSSSNHQLPDDKPKQTKRVPSARKSLSFEGIDPRSSSGVVNEEAVEKPESKYQLDSKANDAKWRGNGENVPLASAKRVSRSLFLSPKDDVKAAKKDAFEQSSAPEDESNSNKGCDEAVATIDTKSDDCKKPAVVQNNDVDERLQTISETSSSIQSNSAGSSTLEADNEASRTSDTVHYSQFIPTRVLRETKERVARQTVLPTRRTTRLSLSLSRRELRSSSSDSVEQDPAFDNHVADKSILSSKVTDNLLNSAAYASVNFEPLVVLSPLKVPSPLKAPSPSVSAESTTTSKSTFGSPPFIADSTLTPVHSPFLGFPSKDDPNTSGEAAEESDSIVKVPDGSSDEGNLSEPHCAKANLEEKVITPLLEAAILESSVCIGSGSSHSTDADLSFRGRIECLKPTYTGETALNLLNMNLNVSENLLNMDENKEKSPVLEKWAERASRSAQKGCILSEDTNDSVAQEASVPVPEKTVEESMLAWDCMESQMEPVSQCSTNMYEKFCSIFDPSSHQGNP